MKSSTSTRRGYSSERRARTAEETRARILDAGHALFGRDGIDRTTIVDIAREAGVGASTVYATLGSKEGILRGLMERALFGIGFQSAQAVLAGVSDPVQLIALTSHIARAVYEGESGDLGLLRTSSGFSPALRKMEQEFETLRFTMQEPRLRALFDAGLNRKDLSFEEARSILWMYTSRDIYRMLVEVGGWTPDRYQTWLSQTLLDALVETGAVASTVP
jgi:AcrR family transcriptional regulator